MRRLTTCVVLSFFISALGCRKPDDNPQAEITARDSKVSAAFPYPPSETKTPNSVVHHYGSKDGKTALLLNQGSLPREIDLTDVALVAKVLDNGRENGIRSIQGELLSKEDLKLGKYPGQTFDARVSIGIYRAKVYLTGKEMIQIVAIGPKEYVDSAEVKKFLDSLKIEE